MTIQVHKVPYPNHFSSLIGVIGLQFPSRGFTDLIKTYSRQIQVATTAEYRFNQSQFTHGISYDFGSFGIKGSNQEAGIRNV